MNILERESLWQMTAQQFCNPYLSITPLPKYWLISLKHKMKKSVMVPPQLQCWLENYWEKLKSLFKQRFILRLSFKDGERLEKLPGQSLLRMLLIIMMTRRHSREIWKILHLPPSAPSYYILSETYLLTWLWNLSWGLEALATWTILRSLKSQVAL